MSLATLIKLSRNKPLKLLSPSGKEYRRRVIVGADKGHWRVEYEYNEPHGYTYEYIWERMTDEDMRKSNCFADDYGKEKNENLD